MAATCSPASYMADAMDYVHQSPQTEDGKDKPLCSVAASEKVAIGLAYTGFVSMFLYIMIHHSDRDASTNLSISTNVQSLGFLLLTMKVKYSNSMAGISSKTLEMYAMVLFLRLCATCTKCGYIPVDRTGDFIYHCGDFSSLVLCLHLLYKMHRGLAHTYQKEHDIMNIMPCIPPALLLAMVLQGNLNRSFAFDTLWYFSLYLETIVMFPQLFMITKIGGQVEGLLSHFIFLVFASKCFAWAFWFQGYPELAVGYTEEDGIPVHWGHSNYGGYAIIVCYSIQLLGSGDFVYYYLKAGIQQTEMSLPALEV